MKICPVDLLITWPRSVDMLHSDGYVEGSSFPPYSNPPVFRADESRRGGFRSNVASDSAR